jgi:hypothetical protein
MFLQNDFQEWCVLENDEIVCWQSDLPAKHSAAGNGISEARCLLSCALVLRRAVGGCFLGA